MVMTNHAGMVSPAQDFGSVKSASWRGQITARRIAEQRADSNAIGEVEASGEKLSRSSSGEYKRQMDVFLPA